MMWTDYVLVVIGVPVEKCACRVLFIIPHYIIANQSDWSIMLLAVPVEMLVVYCLFDHRDTLVVKAQLDRKELV